MLHTHLRGRVSDDIVKGRRDILAVSRARHVVAALAVAAAGIYCVVLLEPARGVRGVAGEQAHPVARYVDPMQRVRRSIGDTPAEFRRWFHNGEVEIDASRAGTNGMNNEGDAGEAATDHDDVQWDMSGSVQVSAHDAEASRIPQPIRGVNAVQSMKFAKLVRIGGIATEGYVGMTRVR